TDQCAAGAPGAAGAVRLNRQSAGRGGLAVIFLTAATIGLIFAVAVFMLLGKELKSIVMGVFLISHGANLMIITASGSPIGKISPVLVDGQMSGTEVDPLPQALILTAIVIGFAVQAFVLSLLVLTWQRTG